MFIPDLYLAPPREVTPVGIDLGTTHKTRINGLSCGEESMTKCSAVLIQYQRVNGRTDRRTDRRPTYIYYVLDACKKTKDSVSDVNSS